ncbi:MAG: glycosyltransferase family 2 protein [Phycisphaeraceae bacterium]|nr:glycosyltransferase family 2 protein [Phycisphaeraceae bacterium]
MSSISVITPVFNGERYLAEALRSIRAQTLLPSEVIVVNDGSTDRSAQVAASFAEVRLLDTHHAGVGAARNHGVRSANGDLLAFLDADDVWLPRALEYLLPPLLGDPKLDAVFGGVEHFISEDCPNDVKQKYLIPNPASAGKLCGAMLIRTESFRRAGMFDENRPVDFLGWFLRAQEAMLRMATIEFVVLRRRIHGQNLTIRCQEEVQKCYVGLLRESLARRRASGGSG